MEECEEFVKPARKILNPMMDVKKWEKTEAYDTYICFLTAMNESVKRKTLSETSPNGPSEIVTNLLTLLDTLDSWIHLFPPQEQPQRFGNKAYRDWHRKLVEDSESQILKFLPSDKSGAVVELVSYFNDGFGNATRIDYGTGHEASFLMFLCCLYCLELVSKSDSIDIVNRVFFRYLELVRRLQTVYKMEPAGSQGVWALDDFQFVPFMWGSAQLIDNPTLEPSSFLKENLVSQYSDDFMFMSCIKYINEVKTGPFAEHSNQLWNISSVPYWSKVNSGLFKMYKAEVLGKYPVVQHFVFGNILPFKPLDPAIRMKKNAASGDMA